jgi:hypothetical protein
MKVLIVTRVQIKLSEYFLEHRVQLSNGFAYYILRIHVFVHCVCEQSVFFMLEQ